MAKLSKALIKKYGISKKAWAEQRKIDNRKGKGRKKVAKRKKRRRRSTARRVYRRVRKAAPPLEMMIAGAAIPFVPARSGWNAPYEDAMAKDWKAVANQATMGFLGLDIVAGTFDPIGAINPFDLETARYSKMLTYAGAMGWVRKKMPWGRMQSALFRKIPFIGRRFS